MITLPSHKVNNSDDLKEIENLVAGICGKECWEAYLRYPGEVKFEIGAKMPLNNPKLRREARGEWSFGSRGTFWTLASPDGIVVTAEEEDEIVDQKLKVVEGSTIILFEPTYPELGVKISFSNRYIFTLTPQLGDEDEELAYWQLYCPPDQSRLEVGPGSKWTHKPKGLVTQINSPENHDGIEIV